MGGRGRLPPCAGAAEFTIMFSGQATRGGRWRRREPTAEKAVAGKGSIRGEVPVARYNLVATASSGAPRAPPAPPAGAPASHTHVFTCLHVSAADMLPLLLSLRDTECVLLDASADENCDSRLVDTLATDLSLSVPAWHHVHEHCF